MKTRKIVMLLGLAGVAGFVASAAPFECGSTGAYGPMNITTDTTLNLPPDGIFNCTSVTIAAGANLKFNRNSMNTPVYLLSSGDVSIAGAIDVSGTPGGQNQPGQGGPGGFDGGAGGAWLEGQSQGGDGRGPGGGRRGVRVFGDFSIYGNLLLVPLIGGSGAIGSDGVPGQGGSGGGGAILIASNTRINISGNITSQAGWGCNTPLGSGGAIRLVAPVVEGSGSLNVQAMVGCATSYGNPGRIRVDCQDNRAYRSLRLLGSASRGSQMYVFPAIIPRLDLVQVAGQNIPEGTNNPVQFELPSGASTNQTVRVQARNFTNDVPIRVVVTPENGPAGQFDAVISQGSGNPPSATVSVIIPAGSICQVDAWTR
jgi:hypothetical protein